MVQHELFNENQATITSRKHGSFFAENKLILGLDKAILLSIGCLILFVLVYSFGFERGRSAAEHHFKALTGNVETIPLIEKSTKAGPAAAPSESNPRPTVPPHNQVTNANVEQTNGVEAIRMTIESVEPNATDEQKALGKYTIQVSTILERTKAAQEAERLKTKGFEAFVIERGRFFEVCIGSFPSVSQAKTLLKQFHREGPYFDAFVRPNPHYTT